METTMANKNIENATMKRKPIQREFECSNPKCKNVSVKRRQHICVKCGWIINGA